MTRQQGSQTIRSMVAAGEVQQVAPIRDAVPQDGIGAHCEPFMQPPWSTGRIGRYGAFHAWNGRNPSPIRASCAAVRAASSVVQRQGRRHATTGRNLARGVRLLPARDRHPGGESGPYSRTAAVVDAEPGGADSPGGCHVVGGDPHVGVAGPPDPSRGPPSSEGLWGCDYPCSCAACRPACVRRPGHPLGGKALADLRRLHQDACAHQLLARALAPPVGTFRGRAASARFAAAMRGGRRRVVATPSIVRSRARPGAPVCRPPTSCP